MTDVERRLDVHGTRLGRHTEQIRTLETFMLDPKPKIEMLQFHETRLNIQREQLDVLKARLLTCETKLDDMKSDNKIAIEELDHRLSELTKIVSETINASTRLAKQVAELQGEAKS